MSEFEDTSDGANRICPYCESEHYVESEEYSDRSRIENCSDCGKNYHACDDFSVSHEAKPDCELNGEKHDYQPFALNDGASVDFCDTCGKIRPFSDEERARLLEKWRLEKLVKVCDKLDDLGNARGRG